MSRIGNKSINIPTGVTINRNNNYIEVKGPKGSLNWEIPQPIDIKIIDNEINIIRSSDIKSHKALHGLSRKLISNMVTGVTVGFEKILLISGVGYRAQIEGKNLNVQLGFSHPVSIKPPDGIIFELLEPTKIRVFGIDNKQVGEIAAYIRSLRKADPYKAKGIRYIDEKVKRKAGKVGGKK